MISWLIFVCGGMFVAWGAAQGIAFEWWHAAVSVAVGGLLLGAAWRRAAR
ncbi:MAG TPA: hypothetical protein VGT04_04010 [Acidobacteriaceae bacterium]|nr:hypothetical protein [Acidobacteriaceae bacterium]